MSCTTAIPPASSLFANAMAVAMAKTELPKDKVLWTLSYVTNHELIFLGIAMACGKAIADPAMGIEYSTVVTAMCRNGTEFGIRVSGLGEQWFTAPPQRWTDCTCPVSPQKMPVWIWAIRPSRRRWAGVDSPLAAPRESSAWSAVHRKKRWPIPEK